MRTADRITSGYRAVHMPGHPRADRRHGYVFEHIVVASRAMGKGVPRSAQVHHVNGNRLDNRPSNLVVCESGEYHQLLHVRQRALDACGNPNAKRCGLCSCYDRQDEITVGAFKSTYHRSCKADAERARRSKIEGRELRNQRTTCRNGHQRDETNTVIDCRGRRKCTICYEAMMTRYYAKKAALKKVG